MKLSEKAKELRRIWSLYWQSRVLLTANNLGVFEHLRREKSASELSRILKTDKRATEILLDAISGIGLIRKSKNKYKNTATANLFLTKESPYYQGDILRHADNLWKRWSRLDEIVKTGRPDHSAHDHESFIKGMHNIASLKAKDVIDAIKMEGVRRALDLGGGPGTYSLEMAKRGASVVLFDMPETIKIARKILKGQKKIEFMEGDFISDSIGTGYDLVFISQVLHAYSEKDCLKTIKKAWKSLNKGGRIVIQEFYINEDRTTPFQSALFSVNMLVNTAAGRCYAPSDIKRWLLNAGFNGIKEGMLDDSVLISGVK